MNRDSGPGGRGALSGRLYGALCAIFVTSLVSAATPPSGVDLSGDTTLNLSGLLAADEDVRLAAASLEDLGALPSFVDVIAFHRLGNGDRLVAFDVGFTLPTGPTYRPGDVARYDGASYTLEFDASANGVPAGVRVDALSADDTEQLLLSFDVTVLLDGVVFADEDVALFDGADFSLALDASAAGVDPALDLDALHYDPTSGTYLLSFDTGGSVSTVSFFDEDLVAYDGSWAAAYDGSASDAVWLAADLDAAFGVFITDLLFRDGFE